MNLLENLGIEIQSVSPLSTIVSLQVSAKLLQPFGIVHGGINAVLAETAASLGANAALPANQVAVGVDINTHHLAPSTAGCLIATAAPLHIGQRMQTWQVRITNQNRLVSTSTVTLIAQNNPHPEPTGEN